jgi:hypothetical protein
MTTAFFIWHRRPAMPLKLSFVATLRMHRVRGKPPFAPAVCRQGEYDARAKSSNGGR